MKSFALLASLVLAASCGSKSSGPKAPTGGGGDGSATGSGDGSAVAAKPPLPDVPFDSLDHDQRIQFMEEKVVPAMKPIFQTHDGKKFAEFGCGTCHGEGAKEGKFTMPNDKLPKLNFADMSKFKKEDIEWMGKEVKPTMAKLFKVPEMSKDNPNGFGCLECHTMEGK